MNFAESSAPVGITETVKRTKTQTGTEAPKTRISRIVLRDSYDMPAKTYAGGMGEAVAHRTVARKLHPDTRKELPPLPYPDCMDDQRPFVRETWDEVSKRVTEGNTGLLNHYRPGLLSADDIAAEFHSMHYHMRRATLLMSGRHLQHGDKDQFKRPIEVYTNCASAPASFLKFLLLTSGSGVGRSYDDKMMLVDWSYMPIVVPTISAQHPDVQSKEIGFTEKRDAQHLYASKTIRIHDVKDTREGWSKAMELIELMAFEKTHRDSVLILDFSLVRPRGTPIEGMQNRPASGPGPLMIAIADIARLRSAGMSSYRAAMFADHFSAKCVLVGGARRSARIATKTWRDESVLEFIEIKAGNFLWSANNSVAVDKTFWRYVKKVKAMVDPLLIEADEEPTKKKVLALVDDMVAATDISWLEGHAYKVFFAVCWHSYHDGNGEPGFVNQHKLSYNKKGIKQFQKGGFAENSKFKLEPGTEVLAKELAKAFVNSPWKMICNPCGEVALSMLGGYCVIADVAPYHAKPLTNGNGMMTRWDDEVEDACRCAARALVRTNLMEALYAKEVQRTNRIGVGLTGIHEYAWTRFGFSWSDLVVEEKSLAFWTMLSRLKRAVQDEAEQYSDLLGVEAPHTDVCIKPSGTVSKLFMLTEGAHLPSMREFIRWVQFTNSDPLIANYKEVGYPVKELKTYDNTTVVGFPTVPEICALGMGDKLVTAPEATPDEQYAWVRLLEKYWLIGVDENGKPLAKDTSNQVSYTLKYDRDKIPFKNFMESLLRGQTEIKCCTVMPIGDPKAFEYQPEQAVSRFEYEAICNAIHVKLHEDVGMEHVDCAGNACPVSFNENN